MPPRTGECQALVHDRAIPQSPGHTLVNNVLVILPKITERAVWADLTPVQYFFSAMPVLWEPVGPVSEESPLSGAASCEFAGCVYTFGGWERDRGAPTCEIRHCVFDLADKAWLEPDTLDVDGDIPTPRAGCSATRVRGTVRIPEVNGGCLRPGNDALVWGL